MLNIKYFRSLTYLFCFNKVSVKAKVTCLFSLDIKNPFFAQSYNLFVYYLYSLGTSVFLPAHRTVQARAFRIFFPAST